MGGGGKVLVAAPTTAAVGNHDALIRLAEVVDQLAGLFAPHGGADRHLEHDVLALAAGTVGAFAMPAALGLVLRVVPEVNQGVVPLARLHNDVAAATAVAAGRAALGNELFPAEGHAAITAVTGFYSNSGFIDKHFVLSV